MQAVTPDSGFVQLRRTRLAEAIAKMATELDDSALMPSFKELKALATACDEQQLPVEAVRVRRWMGLR